MLSFITFLSPTVFITFSAYIWVCVSVLCAYVCVYVYIDIYMFVSISPSLTVKFLFKNFLTQKVYLRNIFQVL